MYNLKTGSKDSNDLSNGFIESKERCKQAMTNNKEAPN